jgi:hypothetical protein
MGIIELHNQERTSIVKRIMKFFDEIEVFLWLPIDKEKKDENIVFPIGRPERIHDLLKSLNGENQKAILTTYKTTDILAIMCNSASSKLSYDNLIEKIANYEKNSEKFVSSGFLTQLLLESELNELANLILDRIINPETFYSLLLLPHVDITDNIKINNTFSLIKAAPDIIDNFLSDAPVTKEEAFPLEEMKTYLLMKQQGYPEGIEKPLALVQLESKLKVLLGLCLVQEIFEKPTNKPFFLQEPQQVADIEFIGIFKRFVQYEYDDEGYEIGPIEVNEDIFDHDEFGEYKSGKYKFYHLNNLRLRSENMYLINSLTMSRSATEPLHKLKMVKGGNTEKLAKSEKLKPPIEFLKEKIEKQIKNVLDSDDEYGEPIKTAAEWYFEALCTENETFKFIQYTIAIESLLGDPEKRDRVTERLSDRCAYLLGVNQEEREEIKKSFEEIYEIRSKIIHRRSLRLQEKDSRSLAQAEVLTKRLIRKEINLYTDRCEHKREY